VLHPTLMLPTGMTNDTDHGCSMLSALLAPGSQFIVQGYFVSNGERDTGPYMWVSSCRFVRSSWRPSAVRYLIELVYAGRFDPIQAAQALLQTNMDHILNTHDLTARQWKATEISVLLQNEQSRMGTVSVEQLDILKKFSDMRQRFPIIETPERLLMVASVGDPLRDGSRWKRKKEPQLEWMTQQIQEVVESHPCFGSRPLHIFDVGGGKGYLANKLASTLGTAVQIRVIDVAAGAVKNGAMKSKRLRLPVQYTVGDASQVDLFSNEHVDLVVALHACGTLSDVALGHAAVHEACFVVSPCCFQSNPNLLVPLSPKLGLINRISVEDWLSVDTNDYSALKLLAEVQGDTVLASEAMHTICALRLAAFMQRTTKPVQVSIQTFPIAFSGRNFCLVGRV
jgi:SAM-dependent methyltransferase